MVLPELCLSARKMGHGNSAINFCRLNAVTYKGMLAHFPRIDATLDSLAGSTVLLNIIHMNLASGSWQLEVAEEDEKKNVFSSPQGLF